jgi:hypothetical protein
MPRQPPLTQRDIKDRERFGLGPISAIPGSLPPEVREGSHPRPYNFDEALEILGLGSVAAQTKRRYEFELAFICRAHELAVRAEKEETAARKAEALQRAPRLYRRRQLALERIAALTRAQMLPAENDSGRETVRQTCEAVRVLRNEDWLPQSLEQEVMRLQLSTGGSFEDCCRELAKQYRSRSVVGRNETNALRNTVHALQAFVSGINDEIDEKFTWKDRRKNSDHTGRRRSPTTGRNIPPRLIPFLVAVLDAAGIKHPSTETSLSKFRRLMAGPRSLGAGPTDRPRQ